MFGGTAVKEGIEAKGKGTTAYSFSVSFALELITNTVVAEVGPHAVLETPGTVSVTTSVTEDNQSSDDATVSKPDSQKTGGNVAIAVDVGVFNNTSHAIIDGGAVIDSGAPLDIDATITYPFVFQINNPDGFNADDFFGQDGKDNILSLFDGKLGIQDQLINTWADTGIKSSSQVGLAASVNYTQFANDAQALIYAGALINQNPVFQNPNQSVTVNAATTYDTVNFSGNIYLDLSPDTVLRNLRAGKPFTTNSVATVQGSLLVRWGFLRHHGTEQHRRGCCRRVAYLQSVERGEWQHHQPRLCVPLGHGRRCGL